MFGKLMSSLGLDGIKIDTHLAQSQVQAGQSVQGEIVFQGSSVQKFINRLDLKLMTSIKTEMDDREYYQDYCLVNYHISDEFYLEAHEKVNIPFELQLPLELPITQLSCHQNKSKVWIETHLDIEWALDAYDKDDLQVLPTPAMTLFLEAMQRCGFELIKTDVEKGYLDGGYFKSNSGCYQELEFVPARVAGVKIMTGINEVEISFVPQDTQTHVLIETDRRFRLSDQYSTITVEHDKLNLDSLTRELQKIFGI